MDIPYTVEERPDTGLFNAKLGVWLLLEFLRLPPGSLWEHFGVIWVSIGDL